MGICKNWSRFSQWEYIRTDKIHSKNRMLRGNMPECLLRRGTMGISRTDVFEMSGKASICKVFSYLRNIGYLYSRFHTFAQQPICVLWLRNCGRHRLIWHFRKILCGHVANGWTAGSQMYRRGILHTAHPLQINL